MRRPFAACLLLLCVGQPLHAEKLVLVAGGGTQAENCPAVDARLHEPFAVDFDAGGNMYIAELGGGRILKVDPQGLLSRLAGTAEAGDAGDGGPAQAARFNGMHHLLIGADRALLIADTWNNRVRRLDIQDGTIGPLAGTGKKAFSGDGGPAIKAEFGGVYCLALDAAKKKLYAVDLDNRRVRLVDLETGIVETVAGNGKRGVPPDGSAARESPLVDPRAVTVDSRGQVYVLERSGHALRVVDTSGKIRTVAGTGKPGLAGDGGAAQEALLNGPKHLSVDADDNVLIADTENHVIRKYFPADGRITRLAGTGEKGTAGLDGPPLKAQLSQPHGVLVGPRGHLFISDSANGRVLKIVP